MLLGPGRGLAKADAGDWMNSIEAHPEHPHCKASRRWGNPDMRGRGSDTGCAAHQHASADRGGRLQSPPKGGSGKESPEEREAWTASGVAHRPGESRGRARGQTKPIGSGARTRARKNGKSKRRTRGGAREEGELFKSFCICFAK